LQSAPFECRCASAGPKGRGREAGFAFSGVSRAAACLVRSGLKTVRVRVAVRPDQVCFYALLDTKEAGD